MTMPPFRQPQEPTTIGDPTPTPQVQPPIRPEQMQGGPPPGQWRFPPQRPVPTGANLAAAASSRHLDRIATALEGLLRIQQARFEHDQLAWEAQAKLIEFQEAQAQRQVDAAIAQPPEGLVLVELEGEAGERIVESDGLKRRILRARDTDGRTGVIEELI